MNYHLEVPYRILQKKFYYFQKKGESDFVIKNSNSIMEAVQACYELTFGESRKRDKRALGGNK